MMPTKNLLYPLKFKSIRLDRKHIPLNSNIILNNQEEYEFHIQTLQFLYQEINAGFQPNYFITFHYKHPAERYKAKQETKKELGIGDRFGMNNSKSIWNEIPRYKYYDKRRNDYDLIEQDTRRIRNVLGKELYGINRSNHIDKFPLMFFFHELGKLKLQYHTHLLIPKFNTRNNDYHLKWNSVEELEFEFNNTIRHKAKCFSSWKQIHIREVDNPFTAVSYVNKETKKNHYSLDFTNSIFTTEKQ